MARLSLRDVLTTSYSRFSCLILVVCQLIAVLCVGTIIYIVAFVFIPTHHLKYSGFSKNTALCSTVSNNFFSECVSSANQSVQRTVWSSCGESCPVIPKDGNDTEPVVINDCRQIRVNIRYFGTDLTISGCTDYTIFNCDGINKEDLEVTKECETCKITTGLYKCYLVDEGQKSSKWNETSENTDEILACQETSSYLECSFEKHESLIDCSSGSVSCIQSPGLYDCKEGNCYKVKEPVKCYRVCKNIETKGMNLLIQHRDKIHLAKCSKATVKNSGLVLWPRFFKSYLTPSSIPTLLLNCQEVVEKRNWSKNKNDSSLSLKDCVNGTVLENTTLPQILSVPELLAIWDKQLDIYDHLLDPINNKYAPPSKNVSLYWNIPLHIDYDTCGNPPSGDTCKTFYKNFASPKNNYLPQSTFPCYYSNKFPDYIYAVTKPTRLRTKREIWFEAVIPTVIAVVSCFIVLIFVISVSIVVFLHPLLDDSSAINNKNNNDSYDDISHTAGKRPPIILTKSTSATTLTPTKTVVDKFSLSPGNTYYLRRFSHPNLSGEEKRVSWVEPQVAEQRWAY